MTVTEKIQKGVSEVIARGQYAGIVKKISLFGSYLRGDAKEDSDVDLLVELDPSACVGLFQFIGIKLALEDKLKKKVDLLTPEAISPYLKEDIINSAQLIYER